MFELNLSGRVYAVEFCHQHKESLIPEKDEAGNVIEDQFRTVKSLVRTECYIVDHDAELVLASGAADVHPNDNPVKNVGRKISMTRALRNYPFTPEERKLFWEAYFSTRRKVD